MSDLQIEELIEILSRKIGDQEFYSLRELTDLGFFGSIASARRAIQQGLLPSLKISTRRIVIPREAILKYCMENLQTSQKKNDLSR